MGAPNEGPGTHHEGRGLCQDLTPSPSRDPEKAEPPFPSVLTRVIVDVGHVPSYPLTKEQGLGSGMGGRSQEANLGETEPGECRWVAGFCH